MLNAKISRHEAIREMQYRLLRQEFWAADIQQGLRKKIEESDGQTTHYGSAMAAVFRGLTRAEGGGGPAEATRRSTFHTEPEPANLNIILAFQTITTAPAHRGASQEVCISSQDFPSRFYENRTIYRNSAWHIINRTPGQHQPVTYLISPSTVLSSGRKLVAVPSV